DERSRTPPPQPGLDDTWGASGDSTHPSLVDPDDTAAHAEGAEAPGLATEQLELQVVSVDEPFARRLERALRHELAAITGGSSAAAGPAGRGAPPPIVLLALRRGEVPLEQAHHLPRRRPAASLIALVDPGTPFARVYEAGVLAALPAEVEAVVACVENVIGSRRDVVRGGGAGGGSRFGGGPPA